MLNLKEASRLLRNDSCCLLMILPITIQFQLEKWDNRLIRKRHTKEKVNYSYALNRTFYHNYHVQDPTGKVIFHCGNEKVLWYLIKGLAEIVDEITIRLNFTPN